MAKATVPIFRFCYVAATGPLKITTQGSTTALTPDITVGSGSPSVGDRLIWAMVGKQLMVLLPN